MLPVVAGVLIVGTAPLYMFFQSMRYKRLLLKPISDSIGRPESEPTTSADEGWDVYALERMAFTAVTLPEPMEWESWRPVRWLICAVYAVPVLIGFSFLLPLPTLIVLGAAVASIAAWKTYRWLRAVGNLSVSDRPGPAKSA
jgi:predicted PurR-regulated permease PerM